MSFSRNTQFILSGQSAGFDAVDFWEWHGANCLDGSIRGSIAEFVIMKALGIKQERKAWAAYDLDFHGYRIEVKSTSLFTLKHGKDVRQYTGNQRLTFSIEPKHVHQIGGDWTSRNRNSDLYIFALLTSPDASLLDAWDFYAVPTSVLDDMFPEYKTISITSIENAGFQKCGYSSLLQTVNQLLFGGSAMYEKQTSTVRVGSEKEKEELQRLIACYQAANSSDRKSVWVSLEKYLNKPNLVQGGKAFESQHTSAGNQN